MTENGAIERLNCMRLFMQINDKASESKFLEEDYIANKVAIKALEEIQQYRAIGTVEECQQARERQIGKKPKSINKVDEDAIYMKCANCGLTTVLYRGMEPDYCPKCGQKLDWSE